MRFPTAPTLNHGTVRGGKFLTTATLHNIFSEGKRTVSANDCPKEYIKAWLEGEQASCESGPDSCNYHINSEEAYWWERGYMAAEELTASLSNESGE